MNSVTKITLDNHECNIITIKQKNIEVEFMDYGATILSLKTPDTTGELEDVIMSYKNRDSYIENVCYLNAIVGPIAGRIKNAQYKINDKEYFLDENYLESENLHSGQEGISFKFFSYQIMEELDQTAVTFAYRKEDSGSSFPGTVDITIIYTVKENELLIEFLGKSDKDTLLNITNHAYFNLSGNLKRTVLNNQLTINSRNVMTLDNHNVPVGIESVSNTYLDFSKTKTIKDAFFEGIYDTNTQGIDHPYVLDNIGYEIVQATLFDPISKRELEVFTTYPSIVVYTHNFPDTRELSHNKKTEKHLGICFETQNHPNGINIPSVESSILRKDETYYHKTLYKFSVKEG
jgi:aldose 1-epimerase